MELDLYLKRIGFAGEPRPDLETLRRVHRAHVETIPYENLDLQLGVPVDRTPEAAFEKLVLRKRGGWCYEMNGLLGWALEEIGFKVTRLAGGVHRETYGDDMIGNHLVLLVDLDETWIADAGFGDGLIEPIPLEEGPFKTGPLDCMLQRIENGWWRYNNDPEGGAPSFDFHPDVRDESLLEQSCRRLQTDPASSFVLNAVVQRWVNDEHISLRGRVFTKVSESGKTSSILPDASTYAQMLERDFNLTVPDAASLWPKICARHDEVFGEKAGSVSE